MNATIGTVCAVIVALLAVVGLYYTVKSQSKAQDAAEDLKRQQRYQDGRDSRDDEVARLNDRVIDAEKALTVLAVDRDMYQKRYFDLRDGQTPRDDRDRRDAQDNRENP